MEGFVYDFACTPWPVQLKENQSTYGNLLQEKQDRLSTRRLFYVQLKAKRMLRTGLPREV
jgi:hypothetical protein